VLATFLLIFAGCKPAKPAGERVVRLVATAEVEGVPEPCGCTSDPLGDVARVATLAKDGLWMDAGSLLYGEGADKPQAELKAQALARIYQQAKVPVGLGKGDLTRGADEVAPPRLCANATGVSVQAPQVWSVQGVKVGVLGVAGKLNGVPTSDPIAAARAAVAQLKANGAEVIVALCGMTRNEARGVLQAVAGISVGVVGQEVDDGMPEPEPVGAAVLVAPASQARYAAIVELHVIDGKLAMVPFAGEASRKREADKTRRRIDELTAQLAAWKRDPTADKAFVAAREQELDELKQRANAKPAAPPASSYFTYELKPVKVSIPRQAAVVDELKKMYAEIGRTNLAAAQKEPQPPQEAGKPSYTGVEACAKCHKQAVAFWRGTVHAHAWKTLVDGGKQYNYDCSGCHVTGLNKPGGANLAGLEKKGLVDVQCEVCHGPGSTHVAEAGLEEPKTMTARPDDRFCADNCHTKEHSDTFQLVPYLRDILGKGHGEKRRNELGDGPTGHELRTKALAAARG
jgi:hypothetical protein